MQQGWLGRWIAAAGLVAVAPTVCAQSQWTLAPQAEKSTFPAHLSSLAQLPPGSLVDMQRREAKGDGGWTLTLPDGARLKIQPGRSQRHGNGDVSYAGTVSGFGAAYLVFLTEGRDASFGHWVTPRGRFRFESWGDRGWLIDLDHVQLSEPGFDADAIGIPPVDRFAPVSEENRTAEIADGADKVAVGTQIDALFIYPPAFAERYPGSATQTRVQHLAALSNQIFANSGVDLGIRLVGVDATSYDEPDSSIALAAMRAALSGSTVPAAGLGELRTRRDATGADLVTLIRPHDIELRGSCGIAYFPGRGPDYGVNVVSDGSSSWSICGDEVYAHEIGHNLGAEHQTGASSNNAGFGRAHVVLGQYHTVMGSFGTGDPNRGLRLLRFSNPQQLCGGTPCGVSGAADNARRLRANMLEVAAYRAPRSGVPAAQAPLALDPDDDGDGVPESRDAFPHDAAYQSDLDGDGVADGADAFPNQANEQSDLDGDGLGDNSDPDLDGDGVPNSGDRLPRVASEVADADGDGVGDNADQFDADPREWGDLDGDGIGDNADADIDGDGLDDFDATAQDLLVSSLGTDRVLRLDGASGRFVAVEIAEPSARIALGSKSALAWNPYRRRVDALIASEVRRYDPASRQRQARVLRSYRSSDEPGLRSGLSAAMTVGLSGEILVADGSALAQNSLHRFEPVRARESLLGAFSDVPFFSNTPRALQVATDGRLWTLDRSGVLREVDVASGVALRLLVAAPPGQSIDATALAIGADGALFVADATAHRVLRVHPATGVVTTHVASGSGGLNQPAGLAFDRAGRLHVASAGTHQVLRYDGASGAFIDVFSKTPTGALSRPQALLFVPRVADRFAREAERRWRPRAGAWHNPSRSGQGLDIQAIPGGLAVGWYTYDAQGRATWYLGVGTLQNDRWSAPLQRYVWDGASATGSVVGEARLEFTAENRAVFEWTLADLSGSEAIEQLEAAQVVESQFPTADWYAPALPGWGYSITRLGELIALAAFYFDTQGQPTWSLGVAEAGAESFSMRRYADADGCPGCDGAAPAQSREIGSVQFAVIDDVHAQGGIDLRDTDIDWRHEALDLLRLTDSPTQANGDPLP